MTPERKRLLFTLLTVIIVAVLLVKRFSPSGENTAFEVTVRKTGSSVSVSAGANDVYIKSGEISCPELRSRDETVYLTLPQFKINALQCFCPAERFTNMLTIPETTEVLEVSGSGDIYLSGVNAGIINAETKAGMLDADLLKSDEAVLRTGNGPLSVSGSEVGTLSAVTTGGNADITGTHAERLEVKTLSGDILAEADAHDTVLESSDGAITVYVKGPVRLLLEGEAEADEGIISDSAERTLEVKGSVKIMRGE